MRKFIIALGVVGAIAGLATVTAEAAPRGPAKFYDQYGGFRGYAWCLKQGIMIFDCNYFNLAQCRATASAQPVYCVPNPHAVVQGYDPWAREEAAAAASKKKVRQQRVY